MPSTKARVNKGSIPFIRIKLPILASHLGPATLLLHSLLPYNYGIEDLDIQVIKFLLLPYLLYFPVQISVITSFLLVHIVCMVKCIDCLLVLLNLLPILPLNLYTLMYGVLHLQILSINTNIMSYLLIILLDLHDYICRIINLKSFLSFNISTLWLKPNTPLNSNLLDQMWG